MQPPPARGHKPDQQIGHAKREQNKRHDPKQLPQFEREGALTSQPFRNELRRGESGTLVECRDGLDGFGREQPDRAVVLIVTANQGEVKSPDEIGSTPMDCRAGYNGSSGSPSGRALNCIKSPERLRFRISASWAARFGPFPRVLRVS